MATKSIAWPSGGGYIKLTYGGSGNGTIKVDTDDNTLGTARSQVVTIVTTAGSPVVTKNLTVNQAACPFPVNTVKNFSYTGIYQEVELPAGKYKLQCWGAEGGINGTNSSYGITAHSGGKGGYSEGVLTLTQKTIVRVYVGGQGSASSGGFNGGGSTTGTSQYNSGNEFGISKMGGGGGATDIRLRDGALLSRMIVAGGGCGSAACYKRVTTSTTQDVRDGYTTSYSRPNPNYVWLVQNIPVTPGETYKIRTTGDIPNSNWVNYWTIGFNPTPDFEAGTQQSSSSRSTSVVCPTGCYYMSIYYWMQASDESSILTSFSFEVYHTESTQQIDEYRDYQNGFAGGGIVGVAYSTIYQGRQNAAGTNGSFGQGANQTATNYRYCSAGGGGGWYGGGGGLYSDTDMVQIHRHGGGSGYVNTAENASYRPSGYSGLQLDSGSTTQGSQSFPSPSGGTENGHSGNGYARITRLE